MDKSTEERLLKTVAKLEERLKAFEEGPASNASAEVTDLLKSKAGDLSEIILEYIRVHPGRSITIAFLLGLVLASRRGGR